jgi:hypothetical protein
LDDKLTPNPIIRISPFWYRFLRLPRVQPFGEGSVPCASEVVWLSWCHDLLSKSSGSEQGCGMSTKELFIIVQSNPRRIWNGRWEQRDTLLPRLKTKNAKLETK